MSNETETPTLPEVGRWTMRAGELRGRKEWVERRLREVVEGLGTLLAYSKADSPEAEKLSQERRALRDELEEIEAALPALEKKIQEGKWAALREAARERLVGISRATGSLRHDYEKDSARVEKAGVEFVRAVREANERYEKLLGLEAEGRALAERFDLRRGPQEKAIPPANREDLREAVAIVGRVGLRRRALADRRASAPAGSPGARLLEKAGPTEAEKAERAEAARKERERARIEDSLRAAQDRGSVPDRAALGG